MGGGAAEIRSIRRQGEHPREGEAHEGIGRRAVQSTARPVRTPGGLKALETRIGLDAMLAARVGGARARRVMTAGRCGRERQEGKTFVDETEAASWEGKPLKGRTPRALAGRNKPARRREEETGVGVRNLVAGTYRVRQTRGEWTPDADGAVGAETPGKGPEPRGFRRAVWVIPWRGAKPQERMAVACKRHGGEGRERTSRPGEPGEQPGEKRTAKRSAPNQYGATTAL
jgi:hypothetical protein